MGGGRGHGFFVGTIGGRESDALSGGILVAAAAHTLTDASGKPAEAAAQFSESILERMRPWWALPYGHPRKIREMEYLQRDLKPRLDGLVNGFDMGKFDVQNEILKLIAKSLTQGINFIKSK